SGQRCQRQWFMDSDSMEAQRQVRQLLGSQSSPGLRQGLRRLYRLLKAFIEGMALQARASLRQAHYSLAQCLREDAGWRWIHRQEAHHRHPEVAAVEWLLQSL